MDILVLGSGEASDSDRRNASVIVSEGSFRLLIDCGHSVPQALWRAWPDAGAIDALYFTHDHPDHCFGFIPVLIRWSDDRRSKPLTVLASAETQRVLGLLFEAAGLDPEASFRFRIDFIDTKTDGTIGPFHYRTAPTLHVRPNRAIRLEANGKVFAYSGDGRPTPASQALYRGADLLFHECYSAEPLPSQLHHASFAMVKGVEAARTKLYHVRAGGHADVASLCEGAISLAEDGEHLTL